MKRIRKATDVPQATPLAPVQTNGTTGIKPYLPGKKLITNYPKESFRAHLQGDGPTTRYHSIRVLERLASKQAKAGKQDQEFSPDHIANLLSAKGVSDEEMHFTGVKRHINLPADDYHAARPRTAQDWLSQVRYQLPSIYLADNPESAHDFQPYSLAGHLDKAWNDKHGLEPWAARYAVPVTAVHPFLRTRELWMPEWSTQLWGGVPDVERAVYNHDTNHVKTADRPPTFPISHIRGFNVRPQQVDQLPRNAEGATRSILQSGGQVLGDLLADSGSWVANRNHGDPAPRDFAEWHKYNHPMVWEETQSDWHQRPALMKELQPITAQQRHESPIYQEPPSEDEEDDDDWTLNDQTLTSITDGFMRPMMRPGAKNWDKLHIWDALYHAVANNNDLLVLPHPRYANGVWMARKQGYSDGFEGVPGADHTYRINKNTTKDAIALAKQIGGRHVSLPWLPPEHAFMERDVNYDLSKDREPGDDMVDAIEITPELRAYIKEHGIPAFGNNLPMNISAVSKSVRRTIIVLKANEIIGKKGRPVDPSLIPKQASFDDHPGGKTFSPWRSNVLKFTSRLSEKMRDSGRGDEVIPNEKFHSLALNAGLSEDELATHGMHLAQLKETNAKGRTAYQFARLAADQAPQMHAMNSQKFSGYTNRLHAPSAQYNGTQFNFVVKSPTARNVDIATRSSHFSNVQPTLGIDESNHQFMHQRGWDVPFPDGSTFRVLYELQSDTAQNFPGHLKDSGIDHSSVIPLQHVLFSPNGINVIKIPYKAAEARANLGEYTSAPLLSHPWGKRDVTWDTEEALPVSITHAIFDGMHGIALPSPRMHNGERIDANVPKHIVNRYGTTLPNALKRIQQAFGGEIEDISVADKWRKLHPNGESYLAGFQKPWHWDPLDSTEEMKQHPRFREAMDDVSKLMHNASARALAKAQTEMHKRFWALVDRGVIDIGPEDDTLPFPMSKEDFHEFVDHAIRMKAVPNIDAYETAEDALIRGRAGNAMRAKTMADGQTSSYNDGSFVHNGFGITHDPSSTIESPYEWHRNSLVKKQRLDNAVYRHGVDSMAAVNRETSHSKMSPSLDFPYLQKQGDNLEIINANAQQGLLNAGPGSTGEIQFSPPMWMDWLLRKNGIDPSLFTHSTPISGETEWDYAPIEMRYKQLPKILESHIGIGASPADANNTEASDDVPHLFYEFPDALKQAVFQHGHSPGQGLKAFLDMTKHNRRLIKAITEQF